MQKKKENEHFINCYFYSLIGCLFFLLPMLSTSVCDAKNKNS